MKRVENGWSERRASLVRLQTVRNSGTTSIDGHTQKLR